MFASSHWAFRFEKPTGKSSTDHQGRIPPPALATTAGHGVGRGSFFPEDGSAQREALTGHKARIVLDLNMMTAHRNAISQKRSNTPEDWAPLILSYWIKNVARSYRYGSQKNRLLLPTEARRARALRDHSCSPRPRTGAGVIRDLLPRVGSTAAVSHANGCQGESLMDQNAQSPITQVTLTHHCYAQNGRAN